MEQNKVCLNINESEYKSSFGGFNFYFSSNFYKEKFEREVQKYVEEEELKINNKYKTQINVGLYLAISLYRKIEKRGFRVFDNLNKRYVTPFISFTINILNY